MNIRNIERATQFYDYTGLMDGSIQPTDIDGLFEYHNVGYVMIELKLTKKELPTGQRISYERLVKDTTIAGKKSVVFVVEHEVFDCKKPIIVKDCFVREMYFTDDLEWKKFRNKVNIRDLVKRYVSYLDKIEKVAKC